MLLQVLKSGSCLLDLLMRVVGLGMPIPKRSTKWMTSNRAGIFSMLIFLCLLNIGYAVELPGKCFVIKNPKVQWVVLDKQSSWDNVLGRYARMDNIIISGTFFDLRTGKVCYAKYTRNLQSFLGVTLVLGGDIYYHPRQQGYKTLDLNTFTERVAVGYTKDNELVIGWGKMPLMLMSYYMRSEGCVDAVALDGGSSAGVYIKGMTMLHPGRKMSNIYVITTN